MTQQDDITQRVLTAEHHLNELMRLTQPWPNATIPCATVRSHVEQALSKLRAPVADELDRNATISQVVGLCNRIPGATTWNAAQFMYDEMHRRAALASAPVADRQRLRELVDVVWNEATESTAVPDTPWADRLIDKVFPSLAASAPVASLPDVEPEPRTAEDYAIPVVGVGTSAPVAMSETERSAITGLIAVARAAFNVADDAEDDGDQIKVDRADADALSAALDALDELPDDQPGYSMGPSNKAEWALRRLLNVASAPVAGEAPTDADLDKLYRETVTEGPENDTRLWENPHRLYARAVLARYAAPQASECECSRKSKAVSDSEAQL